jgi:hypothetical protein
MDAGGLRTAVKPSRRTTDRGELHQPKKRGARQLAVPHTWVPQLVFGESARIWDLSCTGLVPRRGDGGESVEQGAGLGGDLWGCGDGVAADVDVDGPERPERADEFLDRGPGGVLQMPGPGQRLRRREACRM